MNKYDAANLVRGQIERASRMNDPEQYALRRQARLDAERQDKVALERDLMPIKKRLYEGTHLEQQRMQEEGALQRARLAEEGATGRTNIMYGKGSVAEREMQYNYGPGGIRDRETSIREQEGNALYRTGGLRDREMMVKEQEGNALYNPGGIRWQEANNGGYHYATEDVYKDGDKVGQKTIAYLRGQRVMPPAPGHQQIWGDEGGGGTGGVRTSGTTSQTGMQPTGTLATAPPIESGTMSQGRGVLGRMWDSARGAVSGAMERPDRAAVYATGTAATMPSGIGGAYALEKYDNYLANRGNNSTYYQAEKPQYTPALNQWGERVTARPIRGTMPAMPDVEQRRQRATLRSQGPSYGQGWWTE